MKRMISFMMALALILSLGVTAFAAGGTGAGSITITNATQAQTYKVYKIFGATYNTDGDVTYTIDGSNQFFTKLFGSSAVDTADQENAFFKYHAATGVVTKKDGVNDGDLFDYLATLINGAAPVQTKNAEGTTVEFTGLDTGYYVIDRNMYDEHGNPIASAVTVTTAKPHANVYDKNQLPGGDLNKTTDKETANVGDTIHWEVKFTATNYDDGEKVLNYTITDTLSPTGWAAIDINSIVVSVGGATITAYNKTGDVNGFEIEIPWVDGDGNFKYPATAEVKITYSATVLEGAADAKPAEQVNKNHVELDWSCNTDDNPESETETEVYNLGFTKVDGTNSSKTLPGAVFALYSDEACTKPIYVKTNGAEGVYIVDKDATSENGSNSVVTPANGQVVIQGLDVGTYYLKETAAPAGYNMLTEAVEVKIEAANAVAMGDYVVNNGIKNGETIGVLNIANNSGVELPSTGGQGTMLMITIGTMMAIAFAVLLITQKKMSVYHD